MATLKFGSIEENVITQDEFPLSRAKEILKNDTIAILGYGIQGPAQALNLRDNGFKVIIGQRENSSSWKKAIEDGWQPGKDLFSLEEACEKGTFICCLLSDAGQKQAWPMIINHLTKDKTLYFSHGFAITFFEQTKVIPPKNMDVILVAPKGSGRSVRQLFLEGKGLNSSYAIYQDASGKAEEKALAFGIGIGSGYLFKTTFKHEVCSDLVGERGILMGGLLGMMEAQYEILRRHGHSPSEAFNETVEELTQSLIPLIAEKGMDWMYRNCSTTAQRGALDWRGRFKATLMPLFENLYREVFNGNEAAIVLEANSHPQYKERLNKELENLANQEMWLAGQQLRQLRPEQRK